MRYNVIVFCLFTCTNLQLFSQITPYRVIQGENTIFNIRFHPDGETIIYSDYNGIHYIKFETGERSKTILGFGDVIDFSSNYSLLVTGNISGKTHLWDTNSEEIIHIFEGHDETIGSGRNQFDTLILWLDISNNNKYLITVANDQKAILWNLETKEQINVVSNEIDLETFQVIRNIGPAAFVPGDNLAAMGHKLWTIPAFDKEFQFDDNTSSTLTLFSKSGQYFMSDAGGDINIFNWESKELFKRLDVDGEGQAILNFDLSPDEKYIVGGSTDGNAYIIDINTENFINIKIKNNNVSIYKFPVQFHPSGNYFAVGGDDGKVLIYDLQEVLASQSQVKEWKDYE